MRHQAGTFLAVLITLFIAASEPMMSDKPITQKQIRDAMTAEYDNAARAMSDRERLSEAERFRFARNCHARAMTISIRESGNMSAATRAHKAAIFHGFGDLFNGGRYSEVSA